MLNVSLNKTNVYLFLNQCPQEIKIAELQGRNSEVVLCEPGFSNVCFFRHTGGLQGCACLVVLCEPGFSNVCFSDTAGLQGSTCQVILCELGFTNVCFFRHTAELQCSTYEVVFCEPGFSNVCFWNPLQDFKAALVKLYTVNWALLMFVFLDTAELQCSTYQVVLCEPGFSNVYFFQTHCRSSRQRWFNSRRRRLTFKNSWPWGRSQRWPQSTRSARRPRRNSRK